jgi:hypothetical protein
LGLIPPSIGALFQEALDIGVILNALRAKWQTSLMWIYEYDCAMK